LAHLALSFLGPFQATLDGEAVVPIASRLQAILAYLATEAERAHPREALAGLMWPEQPDREALASLRYALSNLRRALHDRQACPPFLTISRQAIQFNRASDHWVDVADFRPSTCNPRAAREGEEGQIENLESATALCRGEFLEGLAVGNSPAFEEWLLLTREQFHHQALVALQRLADLYELRGDYEQAVHCARRHLALEPWDEPARRRLMRLLALDGRRGAALAEYETCRWVLAHELGVGPEEDTTRLYEIIRDGNLARQIRKKKDTGKQGQADGWQVGAPERSLDLARPLAGQVEIEPAFLREFYKQTDVMTGQGAYQQALARSEQLMALARQSRDPLAMGLAHWALGSTHLVRGNCVLARQHLEAALALYRQQPSAFPTVVGSDMEINCLSRLSLALCTLGYPRQALARGREAIALGRELSRPSSQGVALAVAGCGLPIYCRQRKAVGKHGAELLALSRDRDLVLFREWVEVALGWCQVEAGEFERGMARMRREAMAWQQNGTVPGRFFHWTLLAGACQKTGDVSQGLGYLDQALALLLETGGCNYEPEIYRIQGELLRVRDGRVGEIEAERCFWHAIEVARRQQARWWELRAMVSLARLWQERGRARRQQAQEMLAGLYGRFTEGFDLPDLREARALIRDLA